MDTIGDRIKSLRKAYGMTLNDLAEYMDLSNGFVGLIERNKRGVTNQNMQKLCTLFNVTSDYLLLGKGNLPTMDETDYNALFKDVLYEDEKQFIVDLIKITIQHRFTKTELMLLLEQFTFQARYMKKIRQSDKTEQ